MESVGVSTSYSLPPPSLLQFSSWNLPIANASCASGLQYTSQAYTGGAFADGCATPTQYRQSTLNFTCGAGPFVLSTNIYEVRRGEASVVRADMCVTCHVASGSGVSADAPIDS